MSDSTRSNVLLVDDHPIVRQGLVQLINATDDLFVSAEASTGREAMELIAAHPPAIAIVDISLEDRNAALDDRNVALEGDNASLRAANTRRKSANRRSASPSPDTDPCQNKLST